MTFRIGASDLCGAGKADAAPFPVLAWLLKYERSWLSGDVAAGLSVGAIIVAQGMAYAIISNLPAIHGLYASLVSLFLYGVLGTCGQLSVAPVAILALILREGAMKIVPAGAGDDKYVHAAMSILFIAGFLQLVLGFIGFARITNKLISKPVLGGFTSASAMIIMASQLKMATGINVKPSDHFFEVVWSVLSNIDAIKFETSTMAFGTISFLILVQLYNKNSGKNIPGALIAVGACTAFSYLFDLQSIGINILGNVPTGLPTFQPIYVTFHDLHLAWHSAVAIALVSYIETISVAVKMEEKFGYKVNESQELRALGVIHVATALFRGLPVAGGLSRSAVTANAGARTPFASLIAASVVAAAVLFLTSFVYFMPMNTLASVVLVACSSLVDIQEGKHLYSQGQRSDFGVWLFSLLVTLILGVENGIIVSIMASIIVILYQFAEPSITTTAGSEVDPESGAILPPYALIVRVDGPLLFFNCDSIRASLTAAKKSYTSVESNGRKLMILDLSRSSQIDSSSVSSLERSSKDLAAEGITLTLVGVSSHLNNRMGSLTKIGVATVSEALHSFAP